MRRAAIVLAALALLGADNAAPPAQDVWSVPPPDACRTNPPVPAVRRGEDVVLDVPRPGDVLVAESAIRLQYFVPPELWAHRERFFFDGMQMEIGPCYRDYSPPAFFRAAAELPGKHRAGWPNAPATIDPNAPDAAARWIENRGWRYEGGGSFSKSRLSIVGPTGVLEHWRGDRFYVPLRGRADRPDSDFEVETKIRATWAAGGVLRNLRTGADCHFRQYGRESGLPDYFVGSSYGRKVERAPSRLDSVISGCLVDATIGEGLFTWGGSGDRYVWRIRGVMDLFAPINLAKPVWPVDKTRGFGPWGISYADDRWELRRVIALEGEFVDGLGIDGTQRFVWYLDLQTLVPLYYAAWDASGASAGVGIYAYQWSEDRPDYPRWADDANRPVRVLDQVSRAFAEWSAQHGVRWEGGDVVAIPPDERKLNRKMSISSIRIR